MANRALDFTNLPEPCVAALFQHMSSETRSSWRLVNQRACSSVYAVTRRLTFNHESRRSDGADGTILPAHLLSKCTGVKLLVCTYMRQLSSLRGLPRGLEVLTLDWAAVGAHPCPSINFLHLASCASSLRKLCLVGVHLGVEGAKALAPALQLLTGLQSLNLRCTDPGTEGITALSPALRQLTNLRKASLDGNHYKWDELEACASALAYALQPLTGLRHLDLLSNSDFLSSDRPLQLLASAMQGMTAMQSFRLEDEDQVLEDDGAAVVIGLLGHLTGLQDLMITTDGFSDRLGQLADAVATLHGLRQLDFYLCGQDSQEGAALLLPRSIHGLTALSKLNFSFYLLGFEGAVALCGPLGQLTGLQDLDLQGNDLGAEGAATLAAPLRRLISLQCLHLQRNDFQATGAAALAPALGALTALTRLCLGNNAIGSEGAAALAPAIRRLSQLQKLDLTHNGLVAGDLMSMAPQISIN